MGDVGQTFFGGSNQSQTSSSQSGNNAYPFLSQALSPSVNFLPSGGNYLGTLLGIPGYGSAPTANTPAPVAAPVTNSYSGPSMTEINAMRNDGIPGNYRAALAAYQAQPRQTAAAPAPASTAAPAPVTSANQTGAMQTFADSAGMKFLSDNANRAIDNNQAAKGLLQSGSTLKGISDYNNGLNSTYLNSYLDRVLNFSKLGDMAANTLAGAGAWSRGTGSGSSSSKPGILPGMQQAAASAAAAGSDPRLKDNIQKLGEYPDGLGIYSWTYKKGYDLPEGPQVGVMANEVKILRPWAYIPNFIGDFAGVDYGRLN